MKKIILLAAMLFSVSAFGQSSDYDIAKDDETGAVIYKGRLSFEDLNKESTFEWMKGSAVYKPAKNDIDYLKEYLPTYELIVFLGTWCEDSHRLIPELYKVLQAAGYPPEKVKMYGVNRAKEAKNIEHKLYNIERVPTIILLKNNTEVGRIIEQVKLSIENDLVQLISSDAGAVGDKR